RNWSRCRSTTWATKKRSARRRLLWRIKERSVREKGRTCAALFSKGFGSDRSRSAVVVGGRLGRRFVAANAQRTKEPAVVGGQVERLPRRQEAGGSGDLGHRGSIVPAYKAHNRFECDSHVEACLARLRTTGLNLRILGNGGGDRVGQLFC